MQNRTVCDEVCCQQAKTTNAAAQLNIKYPKMVFEILLFVKKQEINMWKKFQEESKFCTRTIEHIGRFFLYNLVPAKKIRNLWKIF